MVKYKRIDTKNGRTQYWLYDKQDAEGKWLKGKMVSPRNIPQDILTDLAFPGEIEVPDSTTETDKSESTEAPQQEDKPERPCLFCGQYGNFSKFINGVTVYLCDDDYRSHTTGEVAAEMRAQELI